MNSLGPQSFEYRPLEKADSIRLLILKPGAQGSEIHCSLEDTTIMDCRRDIYDHYTTLSYVWGDPTVTRTIFVNRQPFQATINLAAALEDVRDETRPLRMWADAICIDQSNLTERSVQVGLMRDIYSIAKQTIVYLGQSDATCDAALNEFQSSEIVSEECKSYFTAQILSRPWFTRVWIYQELILSREVWVQCGRARILWETMCTAFPEIKDYHESPDESVIASDNPVMVLASMYHTREEFKMALLNGKNFPSLRDVLFARQGFKVSDLRDMVYGNLAVAGLHHLESKSGGAMSVDYTKSVSQVFADAAAYIYTSSSSLDLLLRVELKDSSRRMQDLPSWVPDWSLDSSNIFHRNGTNMRLGSRSGFGCPRLFCLESPSILAMEVFKLRAVAATTRSVVPSSDTILKLECEIYKSAIARLKESSRPFYTRASAMVSTYEERKVGDKSVTETYKYVQQLMCSFWQGRLGDIFLDACMPDPMLTINDMMSQLDQYESPSTNPSLPFLEALLNHPRRLTPRIREFYGSRLALVANYDERDYQVEILAAVPEATRSGDIICYAIREDVQNLIIVRPCRDEISTAEDIDISEKLRHKGCNSLGNDILHGRFVAVGVAEAHYLQLAQRKFKQQVVALH